MRWWAKFRLRLAPVWFGVNYCFWAKKLVYTELRGNGVSPQAEYETYECMAEFWHEHIRLSIPNYAEFLESIAECPSQFQAVLDLACGAGTVTEGLARVAGVVVGLDASDAMLGKARARCPMIRFEKGDFRDFHLDRQFDAIVCASDSLNYVRDLSELGKVFQCVANHLRPGGLFVFDTITERGMRSLSGYYLHAAVNAGRFVINFNFNAVERKEESIVFLPNGVERHHRIPIDPSDVETAAQAVGLVVSDYFTLASIPGRSYVGSRCYFVLTKEN